MISVIATLQHCVPFVSLVLVIVLAVLTTNRRYKGHQVKLHLILKAILSSLECASLDPHKLVKRQWDEHAQALEEFSEHVHYWKRSAFNVAQSEFLAARAEINPAILELLKAQATGVTAPVPLRLIAAVRAILSFT